MPSRIEARLRAVERIARQPGNGEPTTEVWDQVESVQGEPLYYCKARPAEHPGKLTRDELAKLPCGKGVLRVIIIRG